MTLRVLDLFSGIGGFSLGLERAGMQTVAFCEIDPYCRIVLANHWPEIKIHDDVKQLDGNQYAGSIDVVCGGYPCQPFSVSGKQRAEEDPRHLWPEMRRIIQQTYPRWVIAENVSGHIELGFDEVASQLENDGYTVWPFVIPASAVGAWHRRDRLWIVAHSSRTRAGLEKHRDCGRERQPATALESKVLRQEHRQTGPERADAGGANVAEWPMRDATETDWSVEPGVGRVAHGVPNRLDRLHALGNAVVPQIPELIGRAIVQYERYLTA